MKIDLNQTSFTAGEISTTLFGRVDIAQYDNACAEVRNMLAKPYGPLISTPGTEFINECKTGGSTSIARLLEFVFSRTDAYTIEMGVGYFRFYNNGAVVVSPGTTPYEIAHTYTASQIPDIHYCQLNDVVFLAHPSHPPRKLTRVSATSWNLSDFAFTGGPFFDDNAIISNGSLVLLTSATITASATAGTVTLSSSANVFTVSSSTLGHVNTFWKIGATVTNSTTGLDEQGYVKITAVTNPSTATATVLKTLTTSSATTSWAQGSWSDVLGWPARVTFHQQRLFLARTNSEPQNVWGSKSFIYENFAVDGAADDDALNLRIASNEANDIKWIAPGANLIIGTYGGDFVVRSGDGSPLTPSNTNVSKETNWGSEPIIPKKIGNFFYYVQRFGKKVREFFFNFELDSFKSVDKTILSPDIVEDGIIGMTFQQNPEPILWCLTTNGTIATMTREVDQEVQGWTKQTTDGVYESIVAIPSQDGPFDEVWAIVKRTINGATKRYVERFKSHIVPDRQDQCFYVHSGLTYSAYETTSSSAVSISLSATNGTITITSSAAYFVANDVGQRLRAINSSGSTLGEITITGRTSSTVIVGTVNTTFSTTSYAAGLWGVSVESLSGLNHLEAKSVVVLADGGTDKPNKTVSSGTITLAYDYFVINVGLPYTQKIKTLPKDTGSQRGTSQGKIQRINALGFRVNRSHKGFLIGDTEANAERINFRDPSTLMGTPETLFTGVIPNISFRGDYAYGAQAYIINNDPLPLELLSIFYSLDTNDN